MQCMPVEYIHLVHHAAVMTSEVSTSRWVLLRIQQALTPGNQLKLCYVSREERYDGTRYPSSFVPRQLTSRISSSRKSGRGCRK